jgi:hypothetical protein
VRALFTFAVVAALLSLAALVVLDELQTGPRQPSPAARAVAPDGRLERRSGPDLALAEGDALGTLVLTGADCRVVVLELPDLDRETSAGTCPESPPPFASDETPVGLTDRDAAQALGASGQVSIVQAIGLGGSRVAAIVRNRRLGRDLVAVFDRGRLVSDPALAARRLVSLEASPRRLHLAVQSATTGGVWLLDRDGRLATLDRMRLWLVPATALAWSPDERWIAVAGRRSVYLVELRRDISRAVRLPLAAVALDWR